MPRIIMLVPLNENVSLTTISLSIICLINKKIKNNILKFSSYFPIIQTSSDKLKNIINKHFFTYISILKGVNFSKIDVYSNQYYLLIQQTKNILYNKENSNQLIFVQGIRKNEHINSEKINYDIAKNIHAEIIFLENLETSSHEFFLKKEKKIKYFFSIKKYKNILGIIFNNINSPFINIKNNFIDKLILLNNVKKNISTDQINKCIFFKDNFVNIIARIPWNKSLIKFCAIDICLFLKAHLINEIKIKNIITKKIIVFDMDYSSAIKKNYANAFILVNCNRKNELVKILSKHCIKKRISGILLTEVKYFKKYNFKLFDFLIQKNIPIFIIKDTILEILCKLQTFNFDINLFNKCHIKKILKYISNFFEERYLFFSRKKHIYYNNTYSPKEFCNQLRLLSQKKNKRIILPESYDPRVLKAVSVCYESKIAQCILLGDPKKIYNIAYDHGISLSKNIEIINTLSSIRSKYIKRVLEIRKHKDIDEIDAKKLLKNNTFLATLILDSGEVDGLVSGAINTTADTIRPALQIIKTNPMHALVSSIFFMLFPDKVLIYGDCAINIEPTAEQLAIIAIQSSKSAKMFDIEPRIAMLSYSTGNSGKGIQVEKIRRATSIVKKCSPHLIIDGPIQYDAAVSKEVAKLKTPNSEILGDANIFIFPDLNSGNITYKAVQRSIDLICIGPMLQGLNKPVNDLSRGASVKDIIYTIALTVIQS